MREPLAAGLALQEDRARSERLLLNILPPAIAERLKRNEVNIAQAQGIRKVGFIATRERP